MSHRSPPSRPPSGVADDDVREQNVLVRGFKRVRAVLVLVPLVAGLLVAGSIGAAKLWQEVPERTAEEPEVTCWDLRVGPADECTQPRGVAGLRWVFPSLSAGDERCERVPADRRGGPDPLLVSCSLSYLQRPVTVTYSIRTSLEAGLRYLRGAYPGRPAREAEGERLVFTSPRPVDGVYSTSVAYAAHPFAVTVESPDRQVRDDVLAEVVQLRPADEVRVRPAG